MSNVRPRNSVNAMQSPHHRPSEVDTSARTSFRVIGAIISLGCVAIFVSQATRLFPLDTMPVGSCRETTARSQAFCEVGTWMLSLFPESMRGPALGLASLGMAAGMLLITWLLVKPMLATSPQAEQDAGSGE
jgi:hypothetical protein